MKRQYNITGMSCAACQVRVEKAVSKLPNVSACSVNLLTNTMAVEGGEDPKEIIKAVEDSGYGAVLRGHNDDNTDNKLTGSLSEAEEALKDRETPVLKRRLLLSASFLLILMYFSMGNGMLGLPLPSFFHGNYTAIALVQMILAFIVMLINKKFFISGFRGLIHLAPNMDTLVALGASVSFFWSTLILFKMTSDLSFGNIDELPVDMHNLYFEAAAMILTLITVGKMLESISKGRTTDALKELMKLAPKRATVIRDGAEKVIPIDDISVGEIFIVKPGENIPADGIITEGVTAVDESALTGESIPVDKSLGDKISAATLNQSGFIKARATEVGDDTTLAQIIQMVSEAASTKAPIAKIADKISGIFVPFVLGTAVLVTFAWIFAGAEIGYSLARGISVLVISCPCALGLATPVAIMVGNGKGARNGILFKTAESLEETGKSQIVVLDKTGTITKGSPVVTDILPLGSATEKELMELAYSLEIKSEHPIASAIIKKGRESGLSPLEISDFQAVSGNGLSGKSRDNILRGGNLNFISKFAETDSSVFFADKLSEKGKTCLYFARDNTLVGIIAVADSIKEDSRLAVSQLKKMGIKVVMLTGDNDKAARAVASQAGIDHIISQVLPGEKDNVIQRLKRHGKVTMVGDGINDAPALTRSDIGIAIGAGSDVALDAADVVLMNSKLTDVTAALRLSRKVVKNIHENLFWAFIYNIILIPVAAGAYVHLTGWTMNPMLGAAAMSLSSFCVIANALRLNLFDVHDSTKDRTVKNPAGSVGSLSFEEIMDSSDAYRNNLNSLHYDFNKKEIDIMKKTMVIEGMMCPHCEATVKSTLESITGVENAHVSHKSGNAVLKLSSEVSDDELKSAVEDKNYKVLEIKQP